MPNGDRLNKSRSMGETLPVESTQEISMLIKSVVLAAGQGTRMRSTLPKVLHPLLGRPLAWYALEAGRQATGSQPVMVVGYQGDEVHKILGDAAQYVIQEPQLGTGHAVLQTRPLLQGKSDLVLVTYADMPLLTGDRLAQMVEAQKSHSGPITLLTVIRSDPRGFGRILRNSKGGVEAIVEEAQATLEQLKVNELNVSVFCFSASWLWENIDRIPVSPKGEYYLTDLIGMAVTDGLPVQAITTEDEEETIGINNRVHLAEAGEILRKRINRKWMLDGVTLINPDSTYIEPGVTIGRDTIVWPNTYLKGITSIGENCELGPDTIVENSQVGSGCKILASVLESAVVEDDVEIGPFSHLRKGAHLSRGVHMGNFGEVKNSYVGAGTKMGHFSYLGDATVGENVNIGAGAITCNFDGEKKNPTIIGDGAFIGSDTMLVAPVEIGEGARTGAGAVVTKDVPPNTIAVGAPARAIQKWEKRD